MRAAGISTGRSAMESGVAHDSEDGRELLQERLALFGRSLFLLFLGISLLGGVTMKLLGGLPRSHSSPPLHLLAIFGGIGVIWFATRRGGRSRRALTILDAAATILIGVGLGDALCIFHGLLPVELPVTLALTHVLFARAIVVPSDWRRTLWISALAAAPTMGVTVAAGLWKLGASRIADATIAIWCVMAVVMATWTSHVLYRLRRSVREARTLGQYRLEKKIGEGGMGVVFRARHAMLRRPTVVKLLPPEKAGRTNLVRFEREVQLTSQLTSPHTVAVYDFGRTPDGIFYYAMEHLDGVDLDKLVEQQGPQPAARVIHILAQVCEALDEAHAAGLIHRDIKPSNIMLCRQGGVRDVAKVLDFGLVKEVESGDLKVSRAEHLLGTPLYLSPEAITDPESVDGRADLYALGAVGYFLLTGRPVFEGRTLTEVCGHHLLTAPVPPSQRTEEPVPADLERVLLACLEKDRAKRPSGARELRAALLACADARRWTDADAEAASVTAELLLTPQVPPRTLEVSLAER
jgi:hypothetical protein